MTRTRASRSGRTPACGRAARPPGVLALTEVTRFEDGFLELRYTVPHAGPDTAAAEEPSPGTAG